MTLGVRIVSGFPSVQPIVVSPSLHVRLQQALQYSKRDEQYLDSGDDNSNSDHNNTPSDPQNNPILQQRLAQLRLQGLERELQQPPNPQLKSPSDFIRAFLHSLASCDDPYPDSGFRVLLHCSTPTWRAQLYQSVGAPATADPGVVASALGEAMHRPRNQFRILVVGGTEDNEEDHHHGNRMVYVPTFPSDPVEDAYTDESCWVECQLRCRETDTLLVTTGWQLQKINDCWMIDGIDWQDFRDEYRPGIGREEWMRICG